ncbi:hypothetical protein QQS21_005230 [Conoideocrella luteorostrata]|uniref:Polyketide synthase n=1 Tax=Conoideocrella luteorostrata TaxID=1105319 RepID=A0AAJ0CSM9_9HYPO|nr:hypothetical protein QQS21_005230 [Conoideocrella luteorostrata]
MNVKTPIHQVCWTSATLSKEPLNFGKIVFLLDDGEPCESRVSYQGQLANEGYTMTTINDASKISPLLTPDSIVVHIPSTATTKTSVYETAARSCTTLVTAAQVLYRLSQLGEKKACKLFSVITKSCDTGHLSNSPLYGLARIIKTEIPDIFGGLFEDDQGYFPLSSIKTALLRPSQDGSFNGKQMHFSAAGSYIITGGTRGMGLEIATWMVQRGARVVVLISRRGLPSIRDDEPKDKDAVKLVSRITELKALGATVHVLAMDIAKSGADITLRQAIEAMGLPPVKGVIHGAGVAGYHTLEQCTPADMANVMAPKVQGALNLDALFPPGALDFFVLTSSIGQLVGFPGQLSYAPANAFLDALAAQRRHHGDNSTSIIWTTWRNVGLAAQSRSATRIINKGMLARGIGDVSKEEAFEAWDHIAQLETDHAVVVRALELEADEPPRHPILRDITPRKHETRESTADESLRYPEHAVAVIGMACRTAAGDTLNDLWQVVEAGQSTTCEVDQTRFPTAASKGRMWASLLSDVETFDHQFFGKSKREASALDPHQRILLETTYHALESAGWLGSHHQPEAEPGKTNDHHHTTGCFIGMNAPDYAINLACHPSSPYTGFGMLRSFAAGRLSHHFGWTGPSQTIDTACSSAMVAIHQACRAIQVGECTRAVAGGANLITNLALFDALRAGGFLSETGACKTFDVRADGYCRGEAVGVVVLKPLNMALDDGDDIQGVVLATGNNQNINSTSITNPVLESQVALCKEVLARAEVKSSQVSYVEAHGTGTRAGDPVEVEGIRQVLGGDCRHSELRIGAVKPNVGHAGGASGVVSLIKVLLMMRHGKIPPVAHFETLNPNISDLKPDQMAIATSSQEWRDGLRIALVNSYGASGNNAAAIVAPPPPRLLLPTPSAAPTVLASTWPFVVSAASRASLLMYCNELKKQLNESLAPEQVSHLAFALATRPNRRLSHVFGTTATSLTNLAAQLSEPEKHIAVPQKSKPVVILFSGQNGNTVQSTKVLFESCQLFRKHLRHCDKVMRSLDFPGLMTAALHGVYNDGDLVLRHATMFAVQYSCGMSWIESGVDPKAICGHSFGEWAALTVSGAITLHDGVKLVTGTLTINSGRAAIIQKLWGPDTGSMIAIEADLIETDTTPAQHLKTFLEKYSDANLDIACYNGPNNYVAAGSTEDIELLGTFLVHEKDKGQKLRFKVLRGMHAYHSFMADSIIDESAKLSASIQLQDPILPFESCHKDVWTNSCSNIIARNTREPVYFAQAISRITGRLGQCTFLEAGVGGPIINMARNALPHSLVTQHTFLAIGDKDPMRSLADAIIALRKSGQLSAQFWPFHFSQRGDYVPVPLPQYQFEKNRHWVDYIDPSGNKDTIHSEQVSEASGICQHCLRATDAASYITLDKSRSLDIGKSVFDIDIRSRRYQKIVEGHAVLGSPICPAAGYLELASHAVTLLCEVQKCNAAQEIEVESLSIKAPLGLDQQRSVILTLTSKADGVWSFELSSTIEKNNNNNNRLTSHATGIISLSSCRNRTSHNTEEDEDKWTRVFNLLEKDVDTDAVRGKMVYKVFSEMAQYSSSYQGLQHVAGKGREGAGDITMPLKHLEPAAQTPNSNVADPLVMDNFMQVAGVLVQSLRVVNEEQNNHIAHICIGIGSVRPLNGLKGKGQYRVYTNITREDGKITILDLFAFDKQTRKIIWSAKGLMFRRVPRNSLVEALAGANPGIELKHSLDQSAEQSQRRETHEVPNDGRAELSTTVLTNVQDILSRSLDVPVNEITSDASVEELGIDSLVSSEILANIADKFKINITMDAFMSVTNVQSLCNIISIRIAGDNSTTNEKNDPPSAASLETAEYETTEWQRTVFEILSKSLEVPIAEIQMDSKLDDLGADSLVAAEIITSLNVSLSLNLASNELALLNTVASLCDLISDTFKVTSNHQSRTTNSIDTSPVCSVTTMDDPPTPDSSASFKQQMLPNKIGTDSMHKAFQKTRRRFDIHATNFQLTGYWDHVYPRQLNTVTAFIVNAFDKLGCHIEKFKGGAKLPPIQKTLTKYNREILRLWEILEEASIVERIGENEFRRGSMPLGGDAANKSAQELSSNLILDFPQYASMNGLLDLVGPHLADCLTGKVDPVTLLFGSNEGRSLLEDYYANAPDLRAAMQVLCDFISVTIRSQTSHDAPFNILEIGAGTGGTTKLLVPVLQAARIPFTYTYSEISASLLARAKKTFRNSVGMEFLKLNIEEEPPKELLGRYHIVVSSNCIHATRNLQSSLRNIRKLVRPDGCVMLMEVTQKMAWCDLVWGLLDGWWSFDDGREYALQSPWSWKKAFLDSGFSHVDWSEGVSRESRSVRAICATAADPQALSSWTATSRLLHRGISSSGGRNLFLAPDGFGSGGVFGALRPLLGSVQDMSIYVLNSPFVKSKPDWDNPPAIEELAATYVAEIKHRQPHGPYLVGGYSIGGLIALEVMRQLLEDDNEVEKLILIDTACPTFATSLPDSLVSFLNRLEQVSVTSETPAPEVNGNRFTDDHFQLARRQLQMYKVSKLPDRKNTDIVLFSARDGVFKQDAPAIPRPKVLPEEQRIVDWFLDDRTDDGSLGWDELLGNVCVIRADGNHFSLMMPPMVETWGLELARLLA